jgi:biotin synthase
MHATPPIASASLDGSATGSVMQEPHHERVPLRHDWTREEIGALFALPFPELIHRAQVVHRRFFDPTQLQLSALLSVKTGGCPEDCAYCPQSAAVESGVKASRLMSVEATLAAAAKAKAEGATRFCMGAAWREPKDRDLDAICAMVEGVVALGLESCATLGMLRFDQAARLKAAGLDYYNHNLDTSPEYYGSIISTRTYQDRLDTLAAARAAGLRLCCGGIIGMGESQEDRVGLLQNLACLCPHPESVPINMLVRAAGTPLADTPDLDPLQFVRVIAVARILMPASMVRLSAGRQSMSEAMQALCILAGANSIFYGDRLLTVGNPQTDSDQGLLARLGMRAAAP